MRLWWNREKRTAQASPAAAKRAVKVEYSRNKEARYIIYQRNDGIFEVWGEKRITEEATGEDWLNYRDIKDCLHLADTKERAVEIGAEILRCLES